MNDRTTGYIEQTYVCNDCESIHSEFELGSKLVKEHLCQEHYYQLFCTCCNSEDIELVKE